MTPEEPRAADLPPHLSDTVRSIAEIHAEHDRRASPHQQIIERVIEQLSRPRAAVIALVVFTAWVVLNVVLEQLHVAPPDPAPFSYLQGIASVAALVMTLLILASQQHENLLAESRAQLTLELAMVSEAKIAKLIELIEHQRRDNPHMIDRVDSEADAMSTPADAHAMLAAIRETQSELVADPALADQSADNGE